MGTHKIYKSKGNLVIRQCRHSGKLKEKFHVFLISPGKHRDISHIARTFLQHFTLIIHESFYHAESQFLKLVTMP